MKGRILLFAAALAATGCLGLAPASEAAAPAIATAVAQDSLDGLLRDLSSPDADRRASAACQIGEMGPRAASAVGALAAMLGDASEVKTLDCGEHKREESLTRRGDGSLTVGEVAAVALARIGSPAFEAVAGALGGADWRARMNAAFSLGLFGGDRSVEPLVGALGDSVASVRERAAWALGLQGDERAVEPLAAALADGSDTVRSQAAWALGLKGDARAEAPLTRALKSPSADVRRQAAWALGMIGLRDGREGPRINPNPRPNVSIRP